MRVRGARETLTHLALCSPQALAETLSGLDAAREVLEVVTADAEHVAASVAGTCSLAERVSGKARWHTAQAYCVDAPARLKRFTLRQVRELDRAQSRVAETVLRIDAVVERGACVAGAAAALEAQDFEAAAAAVARYLALDAKYPRSAASTADGAAASAAEGGAAEQAAALARVRASLEAAVRSRLASAAEARAHGEVLRFAALLPALGRAGEGAAALVAHLRSAVAQRARTDAEALSDALAASPDTPLTAGGGPTFGGTLTGLFRDVAAALEEHEALLLDTFGADALQRACSELHAEVDGRGAALLRRFADSRGLARVAAACARRRAQPAGMDAPPPDPRAVEALLEEALELCAAAEEYTAFLLAKMRAAQAPPAAVAAVRAGAFSRGALEVAGHYLTLEEYYLQASCAKAVAISELPPGALTSSMIDDVFFLLLKAGRRAAASGSVQCCCAVLNHVAAAAGGELRDAIVARLRGAPARLLALSASNGAPDNNAAAEAAACLNDADVAAEYVVKLRGQLEAAAAEAFEGAGERERVRGVLAELADTASGLRAAATAASEELAAGVAPRLRPLCDAAGAARYELSEAEYAAAEADEPWALRLLAGAEAALAPLQPLLSPGLFDSLVQAVVDGVAARLEAVLWQRRFNALGALALDRDLRTLLGGLSGLTPRTVRDKFARLSQLASCVGLEAPEEILDYWGDNAGALTWRLTPAEVRRALALRVDFRADAIAALRL